MDSAQNAHLNTSTTATRPQYSAVQVALYPVAAAVVVWMAPFFFYFFLTIVRVEVPGTPVTNLAAALMLLLPLASIVIGLFLLYRVARRVWRTIALFGNSIPWSYMIALAIGFGITGATICCAVTYLVTIASVIVS